METEPEFNRRDAENAEGEEREDGSSVGDAVERMCTSKHRYGSKKDAVTAVNHALRPARRKNRPKQLRCYPCPHCRGWHLTKR